MSIYDVALECFIDMNHELVLLSKQIDWEAVESEFAEYYCADNGRPSVPIRTMVGMMLLKSIYNLSDEGVVARWLENPGGGALAGESVHAVLHGREGVPEASSDEPDRHDEIRNQKRKARKKFCKRAGIEPVIGHLKSDHRMMRNYLKGTLGDAINTMMAAAAYNMRHWMNKNALSSFVSWLLALAGRLENVLFENEIQCACLCPTLATVA